MYRHILVPTDGSEGARAAFDHALELAAATDADLHVIHAIDPTLIPTEVGGAHLADSLEAAGRDMVGELERVADGSGITVETAVVSGAPADVVSQYASDNDVDLVVVGTHGRTGIDRWLLGSAAERIVRTSPVPVLTVRSGS